MNAPINAPIRAAAFIDGKNLHAQEVALGERFAYDSFKPWIESRGVMLVTARYYVSTIKNERTVVEPLLKWLAHNGFVVVNRPARRSTKTGAIVGNTDTSIAVDMMTAGAVVDHIFLLSGNGALAPAVAGVRNLGVRISVVSTVESCSQELIDLSDEFINIASQQKLFRSNADAT